MTDFIIREREGLEKVSGYHTDAPKADIILDSNENPYSMPEVVQEKVLQKLQTIAFNRYPQIDSRDLRATLAKDFKVSIDNVQVGNGSSELLAACCNAFGGQNRKIAYPVPSFSMYETYVQLADSITCPFMLDENFKLDAQKIKEFLQIEKPDVLILCNPNNPTGTLNSLDVMLDILDNAKCLVLVDEAYMEFADHSVLPYLDKYKNIVVLKTFSKAYGLASSRVGYMLSSNKSIIESVNKVMLPYHVNALSLAVAQIVYENKENYQSIIAQTKADRDKLAKDLTDLGCTVYPSATNFILFNIEQSAPKGKALFDFLGEKRISIRNFTSNPNLKGCLRITVGTKQENEQLLTKIKEYINK